MSHSLLDGSGDGYQMKIDSQLRAYTNSIDQSIESYYVNNGHAYAVNTGNISLTSGNKSALLYMLNNEDEDIVISAFVFLLGNTTGGSGEDILVQIEKNPTGGTLISGGTAFDPINRDFGSANTLSATILKGAEGSTLTGGTVAFQSLLTGVGRTPVVLQVVIPKGVSVGITVTPPASNTSMNVQLATPLFLNKFNL
jgi:hypothetical protein|tara:strand:+ start:1734 stop:2324 length:591 start_codon:yes stop_codon:yes gene_type:complete